MSLQGQATAFWVLALLVWLGLTFWAFKLDDGAKFYARPWAVGWLALVGVIVVFRFGLDRIAEVWR